jgi:hypothetical protein
MAKKQLNKWDAQNIKNADLCSRQVDELYQKAVREIAAIGAKIPGFDPSKPFKLSDYPSIQARVNEIINRLNKQIQTVVVNGVRSGWTLANNKNNALCDLVFGDNKSRLSPDQLQRYYNNNHKALEAFLQRKTNGLNLSKRVWKYTGQFKQEIEMSLDVGIRSGQSAVEMARDLKQYLKNPDKLFRKVRDQHGHLQLSKNAKAYHPGQGRYRSSYKNARRLAGTETNIAYKTSDHKRWQQLDFVVGIEVRLSNNHTLNGKPFTDICDQLQGKYPKEFKFTSWHPQCRCYAISILKTPEELLADEKKIRAGQPVGSDSVNTVKDVPEGFKKWCKENEQRSENAKSQPYWIKDNFKGGKISGGLKIENTIRNENPVFQSMIRQKEDEIRSRETEKAYIFKDDGSIILEKTSNSVDSVSFNRFELSLMNNNTLLHNHPLHPGTEKTFIGRIGVSFSRQDIKVAINNNLKEMRVVTPTYQFIMKRPSGGWPSIHDASDDIYDMGNSLAKELASMIANGQMTEIQANCLFNHLLWKKYSSKIGAEYTKKEITSPRK